MVLIQLLFGLEIRNLSEWCYSVRISYNARLEGDNEALLSITGSVGNEYIDFQVMLVMEGIAHKYIYIYIYYLLTLPTNIIS